MRTFCLLILAPLLTLCSLILLQKLLELNESGYIIRWIADFLSNRTQRVLMMNCKFETRLSRIQVGCSSQGCVLSLVLFSINTNKMQIQKTVVNLLKYADDVALAGLLSKCVKERTLNETMYLDYICKTRESQVYWI